MTVEELHTKLGELIIKGKASDIVVMDDPSYIQDGKTIGSKILELTAVAPGFDWDHGNTFLYFKDNGGISISA